MAARSELISTAKFVPGGDVSKLNLEIEKAYKSALKFMSTAGIKMNPLKEPNKPLITGFMAETKKPAQFMLACSEMKVTLAVHIAANKNTLGLLDVAKEKSLAKQRAILESLVACKLLDSRELANFEAEHASRADPKVVANLKRQYAGYKAMTVVGAMAIPTVWNDLKTRARANQTIESYDFLDAVKAKEPAQQIFDKFIDPASPTEVNLPQPIVDKIKKTIATGKVDYRPAAREIVSMLEKDAFKRYREEKMAEIKQRGLEMGIDVSK